MKNNTLYPHLHVYLGASPLPKVGRWLVPGFWVPMADVMAGLSPPI